jgi:hypothetical protein
MRLTIFLTQDLYNTRQLARFSLWAICSCPLGEWWGLGTLNSGKYSATEPHPQPYFILSLLGILILCTFFFACLYFNHFILHFYFFISLLYFWLFSAFSFTVFSF